MSRHYPTQQQEQIVVVPPNPSINQDMVLAPLPAEPRGSKFKNFFKRDKKARIVLSERDARILAQVKRRAKILDTGVNLGFARFGLDPIIGLVPVLGDAATMFLALQVVYTAQKADIPKSLTQRMLFNVALDFGIGLVPVLGDIGDFLFKANDKNAKLFEQFLYERAATEAAEAEAAAARNRVATPSAAATAAPGTHHHHNNTASTSKGFFGRFGGGHHDQQQQQQQPHQQQQQYQQQQQQPHHTVVDMGTSSAPSYPPSYAPYAPVK
ncbi:hypothetical protein BGZ54_006026 [Gamsiella multidivaricata]|nr:hypothetical protein BGZ54_006026 [Gamsiella multidivaricata]